jgi:GNAT superfamily N-acetyltransferase
MKESSVRLATAADVNSIISLLHASNREEPLFPLRFDETSVFNLLLRAIRRDSVAGVISNLDEVETSCYLNVATPWYSSDPIVESLWNCTAPKYVKSSNSKQILSWERQQAERLNCPLQTSVPITEANQPRIALYERIFGPRSGVSFYHFPNSDEPTPIDGPEVMPADLSDLDDVIAVARELGQENSAYAVNDDVAIPMIRGVLAGDGLVGVIRDKDKCITGTIMLRISHHWSSAKPFLDEFWVYVRPEYRKSNMARQLIQFAKHQADKLNLLLRIGIISKIELSRKLALYERLLGSPATAHFSYRPG